jgi:adenylate cyclase
MKPLNQIFKRPSVRRFRVRAILFISLLWSVTDTIVILLYNNLPSTNRLPALLLRETIVFFSSVFMSYLLVIDLRKRLRNFNLLGTLLIKSFILIIAAFLINLLIYSLNSVSILGTPLNESFHHFYADISDWHKLIQRLLYWLLLFLITQLIFELNEKYSPGVFFDILIGKYVVPKVEKRIVMFMDLKDSTPIAENLGTTKYFLFIRDFIYHVSNALIEYDGRIYQYVGDEIVVSWIDNSKNRKKCILALIKAHRSILNQKNNFMRRYNTFPEFRAGVHVGEVTVGEIGVIKKDLAMSGDTMNTTARIRAAAADHNCNYILSKEFIDELQINPWHVTSLGKVELKGKADEMELFSLNV